ncbi:hypothetical protein D9M68_917300 [compost metagenome]
MAPVAGMAETAMQQDDRLALTDADIPDIGAVMGEVAGMLRDGQRRGAVALEEDEIVVGEGGRGVVLGHFVLHSRAKGPGRD